MLVQSRFTPTCVGTAALGHGRWRGFRFTPTCVGTAFHGGSFVSTVPVHPHVRGDGGSWARPLAGFSVHPHVRGDGVMIATIAVDSIGSPPRAWGRLAKLVPDRHVVRFTPTCVGTATATGPQSAATAVHPRVRGDGGRGTGDQGRRVGSPPRAWGRRTNIGIGPIWKRFTPTCVGTAAEETCPPRHSSVHPHVRGDGIRCCVVTGYVYGSPPRAWGRRLTMGGCVGWTGFTPTCVGTAAGSENMACAISVHPHVRGDGPRPYARSATAPVHPHVRGDGGWQREHGLCDLGSPPRAWGRPLRRPWPVLRPRFTPTCVGTARRRRHTRRCTPVHPHVRGDGCSVWSTPAGHYGSPPRAWGRPRADGELATTVRFTPTCVGTAASRPSTHL